MPTSQEFREYLRIKIGQKVYQFNGAPFGLSTLPYLWTQVMKTFTRIWRGQGLQVWVYLDDILILGKTEKSTAKAIQKSLTTLEEAGMSINYKKSILRPVQSLDHLCFHLNLKEGYLQVPVQKLKAIRKELGKLITHRYMSVRKMAAILGQIRSFLIAMPFLRAFTSNLMKFVNTLHTQGWDSNHPIPIELQQEVHKIGILLAEWKGRNFQGMPVTRVFHSDASNIAWAGKDLSSGRITSDFWRDLPPNIGI